jgi:hypothetical protein
MTEAVIENEVTKPVTSESTVKAAIEAIATPTSLEKENPDDFVEVHGTRVDLLENSVRLHLSNGTTRMINYADFSSTLLTFLDKANETSGSITRFLPTNVYVLEEGPGHLNLGFYFPETTKNVNFMGNIRKSVVPNIILNVLLSRGVGSKKYDYKFRGAKYYATNLPLSRLSKEMIKGTGPNIALLPFTNVYDNADLCMGGNAVLQDFPNNDLRPVGWFYEMLWASPFNTDLGLKSLKGDSRFKRDPSVWYSHLAKLATDGKPFPYEELNYM